LFFFALMNKPPGFAPKLLSVLVATAGAGYLVDSFGALLFSDYAISVSAVTFVGDSCSWCGCFSRANHPFRQIEDDLP